MHVQVRYIGHDRHALTILEAGQVGPVVRARLTVNDVVVADDLVLADRGGHPLFRGAHTEVHALNDGGPSDAYVVHRGRHTQLKLEFARP